MGINEIATGLDYHGVLMLIIVYCGNQRDCSWFELSRCAYVDHSVLWESMRLLLVWAIKVCLC